MASLVRADVFQFSFCCYLELCIFNLAFVAGWTSYEFPAFANTYRCKHTFPTHPNYSNFMTMISRLGFVPTRKQNLKSSLPRLTENITIVIPVKDNQNGIDLFLKTFFETQTKDTFPKEIIIVDNNSNPAIQLNDNLYSIPVRLLTCSKIGPASARNFGVKNSSTEWILFTDSDCVPTNSLLTGYLKVQNNSVGYAGNIKAQGQDLISKFYEDRICKTDN